jgi:hypothetical protein
VSPVASAPGSGAPHSAELVALDVAPSWKSLPASNTQSSLRRQQLGLGDTSEEGLLHLYLGSWGPLSCSGSRTKCSPVQAAQGLRSHPLDDSMLQPRPVAPATTGLWYPGSTWLPCSKAGRGPETPGAGFPGWPSLFPASSFHLDTVLYCPGPGRLARSRPGNLCHPGMGSRLLNTTAQEPASVRHYSCIHPLAISSVHVGYHSQEPRHHIVLPSPTLCILRARLTSLSLGSSFREWGALQTGLPGLV